MHKKTENSHTSRVAKEATELVQIKSYPGARCLTSDEIAALRQDMAESSAWMRAELARRRAQAK